jgi:hypothetical protein
MVLVVSKGKTIPADVSSRENVSGEFPVRVGSTIQDCERKSGRKKK